MEHKKKKNEGQEKNQNRFLLIVILILGLIFGIVWLWSMVAQTRNDHFFNQTSTHIFATNNAIATLLKQTSVARTEQSYVTSTAIWTSIVSTSLAGTEGGNLTLTAAEKETSSPKKPKATATEQSILTSTARP